MCRRVAVLLCCWLLCQFWTDDWQSLDRTQLGPTVESREKEKKQQQEKKQVESRSKENVPADGTAICIYSSIKKNVFFFKFNFLFPLFFAIHRTVFWLVQKVCRQEANNVINDSLNNEKMFRLFCVLQKRSVFIGSSLMQ